MRSATTQQAAAPVWAVALPPASLLARAHSVHHDARAIWLHHRDAHTPHRHCAKLLRHAARALFAAAAAAYHATPRAATERAARASLQTY